MLASLGLVGYGAYLHYDKPKLPFIDNPFIYPPKGRAKGHLQQMGVTNVRFWMKSPKKPMLLYKGQIFGQEKGFAVGRRKGTDTLYVETFKL